MSATAKANLELAYERSCAALAAMYLNPRPSYSIDGRSYSWNELRKSLLDEQEGLLTAIQNSEGPWELITYAPGG